MTLEERLIRLAAKGELTHLSIAYYGDQFHAKLATASGFGYASAEDADPVKALEKVFVASPVKVRSSPSAKPPITAAVNAITEDAPLPTDWTAP